MITLCTRSCIDRDGVGDGDIPGYANNRHRHVINAKLLLELSVTEARSCFGDETRYSFERELSDQNRPLLDCALTCRLKRFGSRSFQ